MIFRDKALYDKMRRSAILGPADPSNFIDSQAEISFPLITQQHLQNGKEL